MKSVRKPSRVRWLGGCWIAAIVLECIHLYLALVWSPPEAHMGNLVRIMYFHVASAWTAMVMLAIGFICSVLYVIRRSVDWDDRAVAAVEAGLFFTTITLITGSLWARPVWNTWWTWDPRLTTTLILWFLYAGYLLLRGSLADPAQRRMVSAVWAIVAFADVPVIHLSVTWWRSIHPPQMVTASGFAMPGSMAFTLMFGFVSFLLIGIVLWGLRVRYHRQRRRVIRLERMLEDGGTRWLDANEKMGG